MVEANGVGGTNDQKVWRTRWVFPEHFKHAGHINPYYPTDGRETIYDPYEAIAPTKTVGEYHDASERAMSGDPALPKDYRAYLAQRIQERNQIRGLPRETPLDRRGLPVFL